MAVCHGKHTAPHTNMGEKRDKVLPANLNLSRGTQNTASYQGLVAQVNDMSCSRNLSAELMLPSRLRGILDKVLALQMLLLLVCACKPFFSQMSSTQGLKITEFQRKRTSIMTFFFFFK